MAVGIEFKVALEPEPIQDKEESRELKVRLDKWLWAARFYKTRALARAAVEGGKVFYDGTRAKPSREIQIGACLQIRQGRFEKTVIVTGLSTRRRSTEEASTLFQETNNNRLPNQNSDYSNDWQPDQQYEHPVYRKNQPTVRKRNPIRYLRRAFVRNNQEEGYPAQTENNAEYEPTIEEQN